MQFLLLHQTVVTHDAIGHDILEMARVLGRSHQVSLFCEYRTILGGVPQVDANRAMALLAGGSCVPIYHHSIYWPAGEQLLSATSGPIIFKYHNITPPKYFARIPDYWQACVAGREQTYRFARRFPNALWLTDSLFNLAELGLDGGVFHRVVPPFISSTDSNGVTPDLKLLQDLLGDSRLHALVVGRLAPNKGHLFLLDIVHSYRQLYGGELILHIVGKWDEALRFHTDAILAKIARLDISTNVRIAAEATPSEILSYFLGSDAYLCGSEHEGFCVPVVEAQSLCLPVVACARAAVPETIGSGQILLDDNPNLYAATLQRLRTDEDFRQRVIENGRRNYLERFTRECIEHAFLSALKDLGLRL